MSTILEVDPPACRDARSAAESSSATSPKRRRIDRSTSAIDTSTVPRATQRAPKSCLECTRRKIKCDKQQPCSACVLRGEDGECRREAVVHKGTIVGGLEDKAVSLGTLYAEVQELRERIKALERGTNRTASTHHAGIPPSGPPSPSRHPIADFDHYRLPGTMEEVALGIGETTRWQGASLLDSADNSDPSTSSAWYQSIPLHTALPSLPSRTASTSLVRYFLDELAWMSCAIDELTFLKQHEDFWTRFDSRGEVKDELWLGCLFAILSISALFMDGREARQRGFDHQNFREIGSSWFDQAIATLFRCGFMTRPTLLGCQIVQILSPAFHLTGNTALHQSLTGLEHAHMRSINLHLLGKSTEEYSVESQNRDIARTVWWNGVEAHWIFIPYLRFTVFYPHHFTTSYPSAPADSSIEASLNLYYRIACYKSSRLIFDLYAQLGPVGNPSYDKVVAVSKQMKDLQQELPTSLCYTDGDDWLHGPNMMQRTRRQLLALTLAYRSYQLHRLFFIRSLTEAKYAASRTACLEAADTIISVAEAGLPAVYYLLWNVTVSVVVAGIVSSLHMLQLARSRSRISLGKRNKVQSLADRLRGLDDRSGIARRGAIFIDHILQSEADLTSGLRQDVTFTRQSILDLIQPPTVPSIASIAPTAPGMVDYSFDPSFEVNTDPSGLSIFDGSQQINAIFPSYPHQADFDFASLLNDFMANGQTM